VSIHPHVAEPSEQRRKRLERIRWRCRRGMLELDLTLQRFMDRHLATLDSQELDALEELLALPDNDLLDIVLGPMVPVGSADRVAHPDTLLQLMREG
jgi:antitoxin CptB